MHDFILEMGALGPQLVAAQSADSAQVAGTHGAEATGDLVTRRADDGHSVAGGE